MDTFEPWPVADDFKPWNVDCLVKENDRLNRALRLATIAYFETKKELDNARETLGFSKNPLRFLHFPREVRDQIYRYALQIPLEVQPEPYHSSLLVGPQRSPWKPPTPGLSRVNKQILEETREVLYSENTFWFINTHHLIQFHEQIGERNRDLVRCIHIYCISYPLHRDHHWGDDPEDWARDLMKVNLKCITHLKISIEALGSEWTNLPMPPDLERGIKFIFSQNQRPNIPPQLTLKGFRDQETDKFPQGWKVKTSTLGEDNRSESEMEAEAGLADLQVDYEAAEWE